MKDYEKRITATLLKNCSPDKAYEWLSANAIVLELLQDNFSQRDELEEERRVLEYILLRRKSPLINLGLAQFALTPFVLKATFDQGGSGARCAVLASPSLFDSSLHENPVIDLQQVIVGGDHRELEALAANTHLPDGVYEQLINRTGHFAGLTDDNYMFVLYRLGDNVRLSTEYDETFLDGYSDYMYHSVFTAAWQLAATLPTTQKWASVLVYLLRKAQPPVGLKAVGQVIERWQIDPPRKEEHRYYNPGYGFDLRSRLADLLEADEQLLNSPDLALRQAFYRNFLPSRFQNWPEFLDKDGEEFVQEALHNVNLWKTYDQRDRLRQVAWDCPDPSSDMMMPNVFRAREKSLRNNHPEWFHDEDDEFSVEQDTVTRRMEKLLTAIDEKLENLTTAQENSMNRWWK